MTTTSEAPGAVVPSDHITATIDDISIVVWVSADAHLFRHQSQ